MQGQAVADNTDKLVRKVALAVDAAVVLGTPVDTGRARSNWQVELDAPAEGKIDTYGQNAAAVSVAKATETIQKYDGDNHTELHITNNLDYIGRLNDGWSAQAPAGFVESAVLAGVDQVKGAKLLVSKGGKVIGGDIGPIE